jgi:hypothetical protein
MRFEPSDLQRAVAMTGFVASMLVLTGIIIL